MTVNTPRLLSPACVLDGEQQQSLRLGQRRPLRVSSSTFLLAGIFAAFILLTGFGLQRDSWLGEALLGG